MNTSVLHVSHNDLDGAGCGVLIKKALPHATTMYLDYADIDAFLLKEGKEFASIFITDVTPKPDTVDAMKMGRFLTVIDHHASTAYLADFPFAVHDLSKCATLLTWEWLMSHGHDVGEYRDFAHCINDFDMWHMQRADSLQMNILFMTYGLKRFEERFLAEPYNGFSQQESLIIQIEEERRDAYIEKAVRSSTLFTDKEGRTCAALFAEQYNSELGNAIITAGTADYVMILNMQKKKASLRSRREVDVRSIAERNGGGGHKNAAGFSIPCLVNLDAFLKETGIL